MGSRFKLQILIALICTVGCAPWKQPVEKVSKISFPKSRLAADAVGLEIGVAQLDSDQNETFESFWERLDQQELPLELRKRLDQNGIRAAIMAAHPSPLLYELVDPKPIVPSDLNRLEKQLHAQGMLRPKSRMIIHDRISNREGQSHPIPTSDTHAEISWIVRNGEKQTVGFGKYVQGIVSITTFPQGDGSVRLVIRPEIHHGQNRPRIGVAERSFLLSAGQAVTPLDDLKFEATLRAGESMILAPTQDVSELGKLFFGNATVPAADNLALGNRPEATPTVATHRILMVRVVQTQMDDLFSDSNLVEKLTSTPRH